MNLESLFNATEIAEMRELARREAEAEIAAENEKLVKETARKMLMAAYKAQAVAELRTKNSIDVEKTAYDLIASSNPEIAKFISIAAKSEENIKKLASVGLSISKKDNKTIVNSKLREILEKLKYSEAEIQELLLANQENQIFSNDEDYDAIKNDAAEYFANKYQMVRFDEEGNEINEMTTNDMVF